MSAATPFVLRQHDYKQGTCQVYSRGGAGAERSVRRHNGIPARKLSAFLVSLAGRLIRTLSLSTAGRTRVHGRDPASRRRRRRSGS